MRVYSFSVSVMSSNKFLSSYCAKFNLIMYRLSFRNVDRILDSEYLSLVEIKIWSNLRY